MKQTVNIYDFRDAFLNGYGGTYRNNFSWEGLELLFDYLEDLEQDIGEEIELDVVAICCDFSEESAEDIAANYDIPLADDDDDRTNVEIVCEYLDYHGNGYVGVTDDGNIIYQAF